MTSGGLPPVDLTAWTFWWEFNKAPYLNLRDKIHNRLAQSGSGPRLLPPADSADPTVEWTSPGALALHSWRHGSVDPNHVALVASLEGLTDALERPDEFARGLQAFSDGSRALADE